MAANLLDGSIPTKNTIFRLKSFIKASKTAFCRFRQQMLLFCCLNIFAGIQSPKPMLIPNIMRWFLLDRSIPKRACHPVTWFNTLSLEIFILLKGRWVFLEKILLRKRQFWKPIYLFFCISGVHNLKNIKKSEIHQQIDKIYTENWKIYLIYKGEMKNMLILTHKWK